MERKNVFGSLTCTTSCEGSPCCDIVLSQPRTLTVSLFIHCILLDDLADHTDVFQQTPGVAGTREYSECLWIALVYNIQLLCSLNKIVALVLSLTCTSWIACYSPPLFYFDCRTGWTLAAVETVPKFICFWRLEHSTLLFEQARHALPTQPLKFF